MHARSVDKGQPYDEPLVPRRRRFLPGSPAAAAFEHHYLRNREEIFEIYLKRKKRVFLSKENSDKSKPPSILIYQLISFFFFKIEIFDLRVFLGGKILENLLFCLKNLLKVFSFFFFGEVFFRLGLVFDLYVFQKTLII